MYKGPVRKKMRLKNYDYSQNGFYFVTICTKNKEDLFGEIIDGKMVLNQYARIAEQVFLELPNHYKNCLIDEYVFMPNHFHGIIIIDNENYVFQGYYDVNDVENGFKPLNVENGDVGNGCLKSLNIENGDVRNGFKPFPTDKKHGLSEIIRGFKTFSSKNINNSQNDFTFGWQKSFFDKVIKNDEQLQKTRQYIINNPLKWEFDVNNKKNEELIKKIKKREK